MSIYTRTGDKGKTSLFSGERIEKSHERVEAYGNIDELNSSLGVVASLLPAELTGVADDIRQIQKTLFYAASWMATSADSSAKDYLEEIKGDQVTVLEEAIDTMQAEMPELTGFIIPGGCQAAAYAHVARTVCRRTERRILKLAENPEVKIDDLQFSRICKFINRLSDYLFMAARYINFKQGVPEQLSKEV